MSESRAASPDLPAERLEATVRGRVQGVGYRYFVLRLASREGLTGWVANQSDGSVKCVVEGPPESLDRIEAALADGPPGAVVQVVQAVRMAATGQFDRFAVRSAGHTGD